MVDLGRRPRAPSSARRRPDGYAAVEVGRVLGRTRDVRVVRRRPRAARPRHPVERPSRRRPRPTPSATPTRSGAPPASCGRPAVRGRQGDVGGAPRARPVRGGALAPRAARPRRRAAHRDRRHRSEPRVAHRLVRARRHAARPTSRCAARLPDVVPSTAVIPVRRVGVVGRARPPRGARWSCPARATGPARPSAPARRSAARWSRGARRPTCRCPHPGPIGALPTVAQVSRTEATGSWSRPVSPRPGPRSTGSAALTGRSVGDAVGRAPRPSPPGARGVTRVPLVRRCPRAALARRRHRRVRRPPARPLPGRARPRARRGRRATTSPGRWSCSTPAAPSWSSRAAAPPTPPGARCSAPSPVAPSSSAGTSKPRSVGARLLAAAAAGEALDARCTEPGRVPHASPIRRDPRRTLRTAPTADRLRRRAASAPRRRPSEDRP